MSTILIAGASRGIGREFVRQLLARGWRVLATARDRAACTALAELGAEPFILDITDDGSIAALAEKLAGVPLDAVLANAGISGDQAMPMEAVTWAEMHGVMDTNTLGAVLLVAALKPNLLSGERRLALGMSSLMSSISSNNWGTQYCYRASKTALNAMWRSLADEWCGDGITCALLRPGFVKTDMTSHSDRGLDVDVSVAGMVGVIEQLGIADTGRCIGYDGKDVPW
ncbi:SDR family NAD(P)-dependent oxidoreductase [Kaistia dalseonensis]|uniref:NAD(P)-dependent dehydrogenase (Short-subunit alcohol dehydrogenase family) n=1 Tax=Kaistia dalseonensis TaxID=410840 RepID=A0ABU0H527_9HYPH|nr:SDR family NAD(P)-dependent oxidoreductase [Kaistia dalseonensis]MCX5494041.1 SDR family NAD(P)-dependent oxidoreductase [Kaistia dalseonensis]MDQ0436619.1 NAD(P)-dependent dehydrogenase (short-subunit alcohol dehydrogenase family) [Kaistia dalseonensis]